MSKKEWFLICCSGLVIYGILLLWQGYAYGRSDQVELLLLAKNYLDPGAYAGDFFVQCMRSSDLHERSAMVLLLSSVRSSPTGILCIHILCSLLLISGLLVWSMLYTRSLFLSCLSVLVLLIPMYGISTGGNEVYYNFLVSSLVAKAIGVWVLYFLFRTKFVLHSYVLLIIAAYFQALVAAQLAVLIFGTATVLWLRNLWNTDRSKWSMLRDHLLGIFFFALGILPLVWNHQGDIDGALFYEILSFRNAHHALPHTFPVSHILLQVSLLAILVYRAVCRGDITLLVFVGLIIIGLGVYVLNLYFFHNTLLLTVQWFKTTIWIEALGVFALFSFVPFGGGERRWHVALLSVSLLVAIFWRVLYPDWKVNRPVDYPDIVVQNDELRLAKRYAEQLHDRVLVLPPTFTSFRLITGCDTFIDYKSHPHSKLYIQEWYQRLEALYGDMRGRHGLGEEQYFEMIREKEALLLDAGVEGVIERAVDGSGYVLRWL